MKDLFFAIFTAILSMPFVGPTISGIIFGILFILLRLAYFLKKSKIRFKTKEISLTIPQKLKKNLTLISILLLPVLPFILTDYYIDVLIMTGIYIILALGLNVIVGFAGLLNLGYAAFYAIGAYTYAILNTKMGLGFWTVLPLSCALTALAGLLLAIPALRLRGDYLAIATLGFGEMTRIVLNNWDSLTNGPNGIGGIAPPTLFSLPLGNLTSFYYLLLFMVLLTIIIIKRVQNSRIGRAWFAIREDEIAASTIGIDVSRYKLYAFVFGTFWAGIAGSLFAGKMQFVSPESFTFMESILILSMIILGGIGNIYGVVIGAILLILIPEILREAQLYRMLLLGIGLVLLMIFKPKGLFGSKDVHTVS